MCSLVAEVGVPSAYDPAVRATRPSPASFAILEAVTRVAVLPAAVALYGAELVAGVSGRGGPAAVVVGGLAVAAAFFLVRILADTTRTG